MRSRRDERIMPTDSTVKGSQRRPAKFAFVIHPFRARDVARKYGPVRYLPERMIESLFRYVKPVVASRITGVESPLAGAEGWFIGVVLTSRQFLQLPEAMVVRRVIEAGRLAESLGAQILGLGAFSSVVGDAGITVARNLDIAVTTGNSYTVATALEGTRQAARLMGHDLPRVPVAVIGATGSIGAACSVILGRQARDLTLVGRDERRLERVAHRVLEESGLACRITTDLRAAVRRAKVIVAVSSAVGELIFPEDLSPGAVVCDVARPRDVSVRVARERNDVLVIEGGVVKVPGRPEFNFDIGVPPGTAWACMAETMILALEGRFENFTLGRDVSVARIDEITRLAHKHGFSLAGFRSFERAIHREEIEAIRRRAGLGVLPEVEQCEGLDRSVARSGCGEALTGPPYDLGGT